MHSDVNVITGLPVLSIYFDTFSQLEIVFALFVLQSERQITGSKRKASYQQGGCIIKKMRLIAKSSPVSYHKFY